ncbi:MAG: sialate O-acetylesterase, partial [Victivallaceae bacterium]
MFKLAVVFTDNMVLQQKTDLPIWGTAIPGTLVTVCFAGQQKTAHADTNGNWRVKLEPLSVNSMPQEMNITADDSAQTAITLRNVLIGEVWLCSGQSNMEFSTSRAKDGNKESMEADFPSIRLLTIPKLTAEVRQAYITGNSWEICSPATAPGFSAVGYFFGRELHRRLGVPVGLINASWGGTVAEAWTSRDSLLGNPDLSGIVTEYDMNIANSTELIAQYKAAMERIELLTRDVENTGHPRGWADLPNPDGDWNSIELPGLWQNRGMDFNGIVWFRKEIELPEEWHGKELRLSIGATDKGDVTYFNNVKVGGITMADRSDSWCTLRTYVIPANLVRTGKNVIAVRVHSDKYGGGMTGPAVAMQLACPELPGSVPVPLSGIWQCAVEANYGNVEIPAPPPGPDNPNSPSVLFNGMINPLIPFAIRGAIWYQGESNASRASQYRTLFPSMIQDWRTNWAQNDFQFLF